MDSKDQYKDSSELQSWNCKQIQKHKPIELLLDASESFAKISLRYLQTWRATLHANQGNSYRWY